MSTPFIADADRVVEYDPVASTGPFPVSFPVFEATGADLYVTLDGEPVTNWTVSAVTQPGFYGAPNTFQLTLTFNSAITGALSIEGRRAARRVSQFAEGRGIPARDQNTELNKLTAGAREHHRRIGREEVGRRAEVARLDDRVDQEIVDRQAAVAAEAATRAAADAGHDARLDAVEPLVADHGQRLDVAEPTIASHGSRLDVAEPIIARALRSPIGESGLTLPNQANRSNRLLGFDDNGLPVPIGLEAGQVSDAAFVAFTPSGTDAETTTVDAWAKSRARSLFDFMSASLQTKVALRSAVTSDAVAISEAVNKSIDAVHVSGGGYLQAPPGLYLCGDTIVPKRGVIVVGSFGSVEFKLADGANKTLVESFRFDDLYAAEAYTLENDADMTLDYGFDGIVFNGNRANQSAASLFFGVKLYGRRLTFKNCIIGSVAGVSLYTAVKGTHAVYSFLTTRLPVGIDNIEIVDSLDEAWIYEGPADTPVGRVVTNVIGGPVVALAPPQVSRFYPGEELCAIQVDDALIASYMNLNGNPYGRNFKARNGRRVVIDTLIAAGGWGNVVFEANTWGSVNTILSQSNTRVYDGVTQPHVENKSAQMLVGKTIISRATSEDSPARDGVKDSGGGQWGMIRGRHALSAHGPLFVADANEIFVGHLDATGADVALLTTANCDRLSIDCTFNNCNTVWKNEKNGLRGTFKMRGSINAGQVFETGVLATTPINALALSKADIEFTDNGVFKTNTFRGEATIDTTTTGAKTATFNHGMWRQPSVQEIDLGLRHSGFTAPAQFTSPPYATGFSATQVLARIDVGTAATGSAVGQITCRVNS